MSAVSDLLVRHKLHAVTKCFSRIFTCHNIPKFYRTFAYTTRILSAKIKCASYVRRPTVELSNEQ